MTIEFRRDLHRRLWIALSNPYWYSRSYYSVLFIKAKVHNFLIDYDPAFKKSSIYVNGNNYGCYVTNVCTECPLLTTCKNVTEPKLIISKLSQWMDCMDQLDESKKKRNLNLKILHKTCLLAQDIAFCDLEEYTYDTVLYTIIDDLAPGDDIEIQKTLHYN